MSKQINLEQSLMLLENVSPKVPERIAKEIITKANKDAIQNIGGFPVTDQLLADDRLANAKAYRANAIEAFKNDKEYLKNKLTKLGIDKYLAIVPTAYWKNVCDRHGLETVHPDLNGRVQINTKVSYDLTEEAKRFWNQLSAIAGGIGALSIVATIISFLSGMQWGYPAAVTISLCASCFLLAHIGVRRGQTAVLRYLKQTPYAELVKNLVTPTRDYRWSNYSAQLILPAPPNSIVLLLRKLRDSQETFAVTAEPCALQFIPSVADMYVKGHAIEQRRMEEAADPIITISQNNATAVLAQFGKFQWELDVIEDIMSSVPLPVSLQSGY